MVLLSILTAVLAATLHLVSGRGFARPISLELTDRNIAAWLLLAGLLSVAVALVRRLFAAGYRIRPVLLLFAVPCLLVIGGTAPRSPLHEGAFIALVAGVAVWFLVMALDVDSISLVRVSALVALVVPFVGLIAPGVAQKLFIAYSLIAANVLREAYPSQ
jgi:hypothetical protein